MYIDGAMGTNLQKHRYSEADFRGTRFAAHGRDLKGNNDLLCLTQPQAVRAVHRAFIEAAQTVNVLVDSSKFNSQAIFRICEMNRVTRVVTDTGIAPATRQALEALGIEVLLASPEEVA